MGAPGLPTDGFPSVLILQCPTDKPFSQIHWSWKTQNRQSSSKSKTSAPSQFVNILLHIWVRFCQQANLGFVWEKEAVRLSEFLFGPPLLLHLSPLFYELTKKRRTDSKLDTGATSQYLTFLQHSYLNCLPFYPETWRLTSFSSSSLWISLALQ